MRIIYSKKLHELENKVKPYLTFDKEKMLSVLSDDAPEDIKEIYNEYTDLLSKETEAAMAM